MDNLWNDGGETGDNPPSADGGAPDDLHRLAAMPRDLQLTEPETLNSVPHSSQTKKTSSSSTSSTSGLVRPAFPVIERSIPIPTRQISRPTRIAVMISQIGTRSR